MNRPLNKRLYHALSTTGTHGGSIAMNVNGSVTPVTFSWQPPEDEKHVVTRIIVEYEDAGTFSASTFGNLAKLTNGICVGVRGGVTDRILAITDDYPIKQNADWAGQCYDADVKTWGQGNSILVARWSFFKDGMDDGLVLSGHRAEALCMEVADDLTGLVNFNVYVRGYIT